MKNKHLVGKHSGIQAMSIVPPIKPRQHSFFARRMLKAVGKASVSRGGKTSIVYKQESPGWQSGHL